MMKSTSNNNKSNNNARQQETRYPTLYSEDDIKETLFDMGIDIFEPQQEHEKRTTKIVDAYEEFSNYILYERSQHCMDILDSDSSGTVGELDGGNSLYKIYRISIPAHTTTTTTHYNKNNKTNKNINSPKK